MCCFGSRIFQKLSDINTSIDIVEKLYRYGAPVLLGFCSLTIKENPLKGQVNDNAAPYALFVLVALITFMVILITRYLTLQTIQKQIRSKSLAHYYWLASDLRHAMVGLKNNEDARQVKFDYWQIMYHMEYLGLQDGAHYEQIKKFYDEIVNIGDSEKILDRGQNKLRSRCYDSLNTIVNGLGHSISSGEPDFNNGRENNPHNEMT